MIDWLRDWFPKPMSVSVDNTRDDWVLDVVTLRSAINKTVESRDEDFRLT